MRVRCGCFHGWANNGNDMSITYFKRYRMQFSLARGLFVCPVLPPYYRLIKWDDELVEAHGEAKFNSFCFEIDASVFPCLGDREGCRRLMNEIAHRDSFLPEATWLLTYQPPDQRQPEFCGTVQGIRGESGSGAIQNLGVTPTHRGRGVGTRLLYQAMRGFQASGLRFVILEVTAQNIGAVRLYHRLGFRKVKTIYKAAEVAYA